MTESVTAYDKEQVDYTDPNFRIKIWTISHPSQSIEQYGSWHYHEKWSGSPFWRAR